MSEYMLGIALLGAFLVAAPAVLADYELFKEWREEKGTVYPDGSAVITLFTIGKDGDLGATDGSIWWNNYGDDAWTVESNYQGYAHRFRINFDGSTDFAAYYDIGIALTGSYGWRIGNPDFITPGLVERIAIEIEGYWYNMKLVLGLGPILGILVENQSYLDGEKTNSVLIDVINDAMQTFMWFSDFGAVFGIDPSGGGLGIQLAPALRNGSSFSIVAIRKPTDVPEPATLAIVGLGLAGLSLARKRKQKGENL
jgi:hypothetical protein